MGAEGEVGGLSAAKARMINKRVKKQRQIAPVATYTVHEGNTTHVGRFGQIAALCPNVAPGTLKRRLDCGERDLTLLRRPPEAQKGRHLRRNPKPMTFELRRKK